MTEDINMLDNDQYVPLWIFSSRLRHLIIQVHKYGRSKLFTFYSPYRAEDVIASNIVKKINGDILIIDFITKTELLISNKEFVNVHS